MAEKRMFAKSIVLTDAFLDMPMSARCLYFTLGMLADDDGFVGSPKSIMRQCGASQDDLMVLLSKRFVLGFDNGVIVIKHWRINNYLRNDRHIPTNYQDELATLLVDDNGAYTELEGKRYTDCLPVGIPTVSTDKNSIEENSKDKKSREKFTPPTLEEVKAYVKERNSSVDPVKFWTYYDTGGWKDGQGRPVKNWKQKLLTWEKHDDVKPAAAPTQNKGRNIKAACNNYPSASMDYLKSLVDKI